MAVQNELSRISPQKQIIESAYGVSGLEGDKGEDSDEDVDPENQFEKPKHFSIKNVEPIKQKPTLTLPQKGILKSSSNSKLSPLVLTPKSNLLQRRGQQGAQNQFQLTLQKIGQKTQQELNSSIGNLSNDDSNDEKEKNSDLDYYQDYQFFLAFRPSLWEGQALSFVKKAFGVVSQKKKKKQNQQPTSVMEVPNLTVLFTNLSDAFTLSQVQRLSENIPNVFCDIGYPFLYYDNQYIKEKDIRFKSDPPFRQKKNKKLLLYAGNQNWVSSLSSNHNFVPERFKNTTNEGDFRRASSGLFTAGLHLQVLWTLEMVKLKNQFKYTSGDLCELFYGKGNQEVFNEINKSMINVVRLLCTGPAEIVNLGKKKGKIQSKMDADFVVWNPFEGFEFDLEQIMDNSNLTEDPKIMSSLHIFNNKKFYGGVVMTFLRGKKNYERQEKREGDRFKYLHVFHRIQGKKVV